MIIIVEPFPGQPRLKFRGQPPGLRGAFAGNRPPKGRSTDAFRRDYSVQWKSASHQSVEFLVFGTKDFRMGGGVRGVGASWGFMRFSCRSGPQ